MNFKQKITQVLYDKYLVVANAQDPTPELIATLSTAANDTADAIANAVDDDFMEKLGTVAECAKALAEAVLSSPTVPNDGGASFKAGLAESAVDLSAASSLLSASVEEYRG